MSGKSYNEPKAEIKQIDSTREDLFFQMNGITLIEMPQEGYRELGLSYDQAKAFLASFSNFFIACMKASEAPSVDKDKSH